VKSAMMKCLTNRLSPKHSAGTHFPVLGRVHAIACLLFTACAADLSAADLPVREVVLYKHGIGYFQRSGTVAAGDSARLEFKAQEMNDVLKSLTVTEKSDGAITGLRYDASESLAKKLEEFPFQLGERQPLSSVIDQLKGARVSLAFGGETLAGAIIGARVIAASERQLEREQISLMLDSGEIRAVDLSAATSLRFPDSGLNRQFQDYLRALLGARSREKRSVYIDSTSKKQRDISAGYIVPMPVWKSSYRLIFDSASQSTSQSTLEGWAIVDNTTGEDWTNVQLALVSGRPISFVSRLYEPRYVARPTAELPEDRAQAPAIFGGAIGAVRAAPPPAAAPMARAAPAAAFAAGGGFNAPRAEASSIASIASARELGELFEYRIPALVTVRSNESAMLPFLQQKITARKLLIYADRSSPNPMNAAELTNSTGKTLDGGPVTVFDGGAYGGEALMETLKASDKRLIAYGVDLGTRITTNFESKSETVRELRASRGVLTSRIAYQETRTYSIHNADQKPKLLIIEHPARAGFSLLGRTPSEKTAAAYRFEIRIAAGGSETFPVAEERVFESTTVVSSLTSDGLVALVQNKALSDAGRKQLEEVGRAKEQIAGLDINVRDADQQTKDMTADQDRIRKNIASLNQVSGQQDVVQKYARQLADQEIQLAALRDSKADLERQRNAAQQQLNRLMGSLSF